LREIPAPVGRIAMAVFSVTPWAEKAVVT